MVRSSHCSPFLECRPTAKAGTSIMSRPDPVGSPVYAVSYRRVFAAVDQLANELTVTDLRSLKVRSGEHIAAILLTSFLGVPPFEVDTAGGVDMKFLPPDRLDGLFKVDDLPMAFEIKSMRGPYR